MEMLTAEQAFRAMCCYLQAYRERFERAELGDVLSDLQPAEAGVSSDPAAREDFMLCARRVVGEAESPSEPN